MLCILGALVEYAKGGSVTINCSGRSFTGNLFWDGKWWQVSVGEYITIRFRYDDIHSVDNRTINLYN